MNTEVKAMIGEEIEELAESRSECEFVELGEVSKDTQSGFFGFADGGFGFGWF